MSTLEDSIAPTEPTNTPLNDTSSSSVPFFKRKPKSKPTIRKRPVTPQPASELSSSLEVSSSSPSSEDEDGNDTSSRPVKRRKKHGLSESSKTASTPLSITKDTITSTNPLHVLSTNDFATKQTTSQAESNLEYLARKNTSKQQQQESVAPPDLTTYRGTSNYATFLKKQQPAGPIKVPTNIRTITVTDFAPDVCKDYKQTGFCGFGDTCKFLHAREDYAQGWELDKDWEIKKKNPNAKTHVKTLDTAYKPVREKDDKNSREEEELKNIPFKCVICKGDYKAPVVTKCGHFFCEKCALGRYREGKSSCAICGGRTDGVFTMAKGLQKKLDMKKEREEAREKKEQEEEETRKNAGPIIQGGW